MADFTEGYIAEAPTSAGTYVTVPALDGGRQRKGPCLGRPWGALTPVRGDRVLIADVAGTYWLVSWEA